MGIQRIGLVNGAFDLFHEGHRQFLLTALSHCDFLIVGVNRDASVTQLKGPERPFVDLNRRMYAVNAYANMTVAFNGDPRELVARYRPDLVIRGWDQDWFDVWGMVPVVVGLPRFGTISTTQIASERRERSKRQAHEGLGRRG